jgi:hypothetical protein
MKKSLSIASSLAISFSVNLGIPTVAQADPNYIPDYCKAVLSGSGFPLGPCVSYFNENGIVSICKVLTAYNYFDNVGDCVSQLTQSNH